MKKSILIFVVLLFATAGAFAQVVTTGTFTDNRDHQVYKTVQIGDQVWMAENLNYYTSNSWLYENYEIFERGYDAKYGRCYFFNEARNVCPNGWHLPSKSEYERLLDYSNNNNIDLYSKHGSHSDFNQIWTQTYFKSGNITSSSRLLTSTLVNFYSTSDAVSAFTGNHFNTVWRDNEAAPIRCIKD